MNGVGAFDFAITLHETDNFLGVGIAPDMTFAVLAKFAILGDLAGGIGVDGVTVVRKVQARKFNSGEWRLWCACIVDE